MSATNYPVVDQNTYLAPTAPPVSERPAPYQDSPHTIRQNPTASDINSTFPLPILTPDRPQPALAPRQLAAIALLTSGKSTSSVAALLGVHRSTLHAWKNDPTFAAELNARQSDLADTIDRRLRRILFHATQTAIDSLHADDPDQAHRNAFRLICILRPWMPRLTPNDPPPAPPQPVENTNRR